MELTFRTVPTSGIFQLSSSRWGNSSCGNTHLSLPDTQPRVTSFRSCHVPGWDYDNGSCLACAFHASNMYGYQHAVRRQPQHFHVWTHHAEDVPGALLQHHLYAQPAPSLRSADCSPRHGGTAFSGTGTFTYRYPCSFQMSKYMLTSNIR